VSTRFNKLSCEYNLALGACQELQALIPAQGTASPRLMQMPANALGEILKQLTVFGPLSRFISDERNPIWALDTRKSELL
jgi:hypothetical protein